MRLRSWLLPETPDVLALLHGQMAVTIEGVGAFAAWAAGDVTAAQAVRDAELRGDAAKRDLLSALRAAFVTAIEPEDVFTLSSGVDRILDHTRDLVNESDALACPPDAGIAQMAALLTEAVQHIDEAIACLGSDGDEATRAADAAIRAERRLENAYYDGMATLLEVEDRAQRIARRELYRGCYRLGEIVVDVADRIVYAVVKQS